MAWLTEWFVLWSWSFWLLMGVEVAFLAAFLWDDDDLKVGKSILAVFVGLALLQFIGKIPVFQTLIANPRLVLYFTGLYAVAGTVWMSAKWVLYVKAKVRNYEQEIRDEFILDNKIKGDIIPEELKPLLREQIDTRYGPGLMTPPQVNSHKEDLFGWFVLWPFSAILTILKDPVRRLFESIYHHLRGWLQAASDRIWKRILVDAGMDKPA